MRPKITEEDIRKKLLERSILKGKFSRRSGRKSDMKRPVKYEGIRTKIESLLAENTSNKSNL